MIFSMTGYGRGEVQRDGFRALFEVSSLNSRFLEISMRTPRWMAGFEPGLKALVASRVRRGKVLAQLTLDKTSPETMARINEPLFQWYVETLKRLAQKHRLGDTLSISDVLSLPEIWATDEAAGHGELLEGIIQEALGLALDHLRQLRQAEGKKLSEAFRSQIERIRNVEAEVRQRAVGQVDEYRSRLTRRVEELFGTSGYDMQRLAQEVAYLAERTDITEECDRIEIHCSHFLDALEASEPVGRRLNFLLQELNREVNTLGSKSGDIGISGLVVDLKDELEKLREQVQNVE